MDGRDVAAHIPRLRRYARALVGDRYRADDLVQDTLERALNKFHLWRPGSDLRAWLFAIMHNVFVNQLRSRGVQVTTEFDEQHLDVAAPPVSDRLELRDLEAALAQLSVDQRSVVLLIALEEMSYADVARTLGIPIGTVMSRLARGRERLRSLMSGEASPSGLRVIK